MKTLIRLITFIICTTCLYSPSSVAETQLALLANRTQVEAGDKLGVSLALYGQGQYDVYVAVTGGALGEQLYFFSPQGDLQSLTQGLPVKLSQQLNLDNAELAQSLLSLLPEINLVGFPGNYTFYAALTASNQFEVLHLDQLPVTIKE